ncbi:hypothetical protein ACOJUR_08590 [Alicyclobacillus tolerans]|uniref:hypothetical protein n=1 Tax=Alicyclobacillus tolerans TaxID=90970 RepID=UPI003B819232
MEYLENVQHISLVERYPSRRGEGEDARKSDTMDGAVDADSATGGTGWARGPKGASRSGQRGPHC